MKRNSKKFRDYLSEGIYSIQRIESISEKKKISKIYLELGSAINREPSTIEWYRKGNIPIAQNEVKQLAKEIFIRGSMDINWLENFLKSADYPNWLVVRDELLVPGTNILDSNSNNLYRRLLMEVVKTVKSDGHVESIHFFEIQTTSENPLSVIRHRTMTYTSNFGDNFHLEFQGSFREDGGYISCDILASHETMCVWKINFNPPLAKGMKAKYSYKISALGIYSMVSEDIYQQFKMRARQNNFEDWGITITAPTDILKMSIKFPHDYSISLPTGGFDVYSGLNQVIWEKTRLISNNNFCATFDKSLRQWTLTLTVPMAQVGYTYQLEWLPPSRDNYVFK